MWSASSLEVFVEAYPTVVVGIVAVLDSSQALVEGGADRTGVAVLADDVALVFVEVIYAQDRADDSCRTAGTCFVEGSELLDMDGAAFDREAHIFSQLHEALVRDRGQDRRALRGDVALATDPEEVRRPALIDVELLLSIEVDDGRVALIVGEDARAKAGGVVPPDLVLPGPEGCGTVVATHDRHRAGAEARLEVSTYGRDEHEEHVFARGADADLLTEPDHQGADIE